MLVDQRKETLPNFHKACTIATRNKKTTYLLEKTLKECRERRLDKVSVVAAVVKEVKSKESARRKAPDLPAGLQELFDPRRLPG